MRRAVLTLTVLLVSGLCSQAQTTGAQPSVTLKRVPAAPRSAATCALPTGPLPSQTRAVFILDTSGSMRGIGDGRADIFGRVKAAVNAYVRVQRPDRVELVTFDSGLRQRRSYTLPADTGRWKTDLAALRADGRNTYLYRSVAQALAPLDTAGQYATTVFVLTDGIDNDPNPAYTAARALAAFQARGPLDTLSYIALGAGIPPEAQRALAASGYAQGLSLPVGRVPTLADFGNALISVADPARIPVPFPNGTPLTLVPGAAAEQVRLAAGQVQEGAARLNVTGHLPYGTPVLLCAPPSIPGGLPRRALLRLNVGAAPSWLWLNPGADRGLRVGETVTLRYRLAPGFPAAGLALRLPPGLTGELLWQPGGRDLAMRLTNTALEAGRSVAPSLVFADGQTRPLPAVTGRRPAGVGSLAAWLLPPLAVLLGLGLLGAAWPALRRRRFRQSPSRPPTPTVPTVEGVQYREDRTLALVGTGGRVTAVSTPLGAPFDLGLLARVPHLSGLRFQQDRDGLRVLRLPADLEVRQGDRLLHEDDVILPGTLLDVAVARPARQPPLGTLVGLGLPLRLRAKGVTLHVTGPYGDHALPLRPGITDLGVAFGAPALSGLKLTISGPHILLAALPRGLQLRRAADQAELRPGTYLPPEAQLEWIGGDSER
ncbi:vWA domain-containing protein [Deinococcus geothermalis]|uniref:vWA domain-containing protein n=1 Tax=Deinococcus geothermalis TaxID=68909 RepID=UPI0023565B3F|nr:vWA domain-containing protein [Deinococcus geothermalis]